MLKNLRPLVAIAALIGYFYIDHPTAPVILTGMVAALIVVTVELYRNGRT